MKKDIIKRYERNPIITKEHLPCDANAVFNSGAIKVNDKYIMVLRIENKDRSQHFRVAVSMDGYNFDISPNALEFENADELHEFGGIYYDPRITCIDGEYILMFAVHNKRYGVRIGIARTKDFSSLEWIGFGSQVDNRNAVLFPEKINGLYARLDRPYGHNGQKKNIWISYSPDLIFWGRSQCILETRNMSWDEEYIGAGAVPIKTDKGWLEIYHGVYRTYCGVVYRLGTVLFDLEDPSKVIGRSKGYVLGPDLDYERVGDVPNVVFTCGAILEDDGEVKIYYGGADQVQCVATAKLQDLLDSCEPA